MVLIIIFVFEIFYIGSHRATVAIPNLQFQFVPTDGAEVKFRKKFETSKRFFIYL